MTYRECLDYLAGLGQELSAKKFDLETIRRALSVLGHPERAYPTVIVAGTNGKGSAAAMLSSILDCAGYRTGLYTSPHLVRVNERIRVAGSHIDDNAFAAALTEAREAGEENWKALGRLLSYFELLTAAAFLYFARARVEMAVLEVGMGGRLDATNVTEPRVAIITNVDLDHQEILGSTRALIAREKAGVIRGGRPVVSGCEHSEARQVIRGHCQELGAELLDLDEIACASNLRDDDGKFVFDLTVNDEVFRDLAPALMGRFQIRNATAAITAAWRLRREGFTISERAIQEGLRAVRWPGRLEIVHRQPLVLLDGAHNAAAARKVAEFILEQFTGRRLRLVYASMRDKSIEEISAALFPLAEEVYVTRTAAARAASPEEIIERSGSSARRLVLEPEPAAAIERACRATGDNDVVLVAGSLYLVGAIQQVLSKLSLEVSSAP